MIDESIQWVDNKLLKIDQKADAWKKFQNEMEEKRKSKKKHTLLQFLTGFSVVSKNEFR